MEGDPPWEGGGQGAGVLSSLSAVHEFQDEERGRRQGSQTARKGEDKTPDTPKPQRGNRKCGLAAWQVVSRSSGSQGAEQHVTSGGKGFTSFPLTQGMRGGGKQTGRLEDEPLLVEGALEVSGDGRAGAPGGGGVSQGGQCWGALLLQAGLAGLPPRASSRSPHTRGGVLSSHWVRSW